MAATAAMVAASDGRGGERALEQGMRGRQKGQTQNYFWRWLQWLSTAVVGEERPRGSTGPGGDEAGARNCYGQLRWLQWLSAGEESLRGSAGAGGMEAGLQELKILLSNDNGCNGCWQRWQGRRGGEGVPKQGRRKKGWIGGLDFLSR